MTQVDFHFNVPNRLFYACQVAATVFRRGMTLAVWSADAARLQAFNAMLWEKDPLSFIPHVPAEHPGANETPVRFSTSLEKLSGDVLILLDDHLPPTWESDFSRFTRIIDVVSTQEKELALSRDRFRAYKKTGVELVTHDRRTE